MFNLHDEFTMKQNHEFLVDQVEKRLINYLNKNDIKIGQSIPKEMELVDILGVSRTVVREALGRLRTQGLLESKRRRGTILTSPDISVVLGNSLNPNVLDNNTLMDYFEMRLSLEIGMADLIMVRKTKKDIQELKEIIGEEPVVTNNIIFKTDHEIKFHGKLYSITRNQSMMKFQKLLLPIFDYVHRSGLMKKPVRPENFVSHADIVNIIENGNGDDLRNAMRKHLDTHFQRILG